MTPDAKRALSTTVRSLRGRLIEDLHAATDTAYRLSVRMQDADLDEAARTRRARLETWVAEQLRAQSASDPQSKKARTGEDFRREAEKQAAYTLLNRLVILRLMEASAPNNRPLRAQPVATGGWESLAYKTFREIAPALVQADDTEGYGLLLQLVFEELATELPGLYGPMGIADLIPVPAPTLRHIVEELDKPELASCWTDDLALGWVYQYWNDPERKTIDDKLDAGGKLESHEIASKTQLFTERYMVDWLLQNSLGPMWLAMCRKNGWTPEVETPEADGTSLLQRLEARRIEWRAKRDAGEVSLTDLMPLHTDAERRWAYFVPQPIPKDAVVHAPDTVRDLKVLDPALGSGHFLVVAMDLLVALYREEARHRGLNGQDEWTDRAIVERILSHNLHGIDLDPRAVQIAAAALWLKARQIAPAARPERLNLVASNLRLASLPDDDPALVELRLEVERETGIPGALTETIVYALRGADHIGSLLKVDRAVDQAIEAHELTVAARFGPQQVGMFDASSPQQPTVAFEAVAARRSLLDRLETFLSRHTGGDDLGLRLRGEQLAAGVRFVRIIREGAYDLVVANPPYQGTSKMADARYIEEHYPLGKADLYAAFLVRGLELVHEGGVSSMLTIRNWMFIKQFAALREKLLNTYRLLPLADLDWGAFREMKDVKVAVSCFQALLPASTGAIAIAPTGHRPSGRTLDDFEAKNSGLLLGVERYDFDPLALKVVPQWPLIYWWNSHSLVAYQGVPLLGKTVRVSRGVKSGSDQRFTRHHFEVHSERLSSANGNVAGTYGWALYVMGGGDTEWMEPATHVINWKDDALELKVYGSDCAPATVRLRDSSLYFRPGVAFSPTGTTFRARVHRFPSIIGDKGASAFPESVAAGVCTLNSAIARQTLESLNPTVSFQVGDVNRLPFYQIDDAEQIFSTFEAAFAAHEYHREASLEFRKPGPSSWRYAQDWAQAAVDRPQGAPLPAYQPEYDAESATDHVSFALGASLGRFGSNGEGIRNGKDDLSRALPAGILFLDRTLDGDDKRDSLGHPATELLHQAWAEHRVAIDAGRASLREWLAVDFFKDVHRGMYENRPVHWPLSSEEKTFVAWVNIHRFTDRTLLILLADHLNPTLNRIEGELIDLRAARDGFDKKAARAAEKHYDRLVKAKEELQAFIGYVEQCADRGAPSTDSKCPPREQDARYSPDLDDGVMVNGAALWPLLEPQWKDPKKWWKQLSEAKGKKDYDWSHLAMRYWPTRVDEKCQKDPSLGVAHGCFWRYNPERAWAWELRLQDEIGPDFRIDETSYRPGGRDVGDHGSGPHRNAWLRDRPLEALAAVEKEAVRRMGRSKSRKLLPEMRILEAGLWSAIPNEVWDVELRLSEKQGSEFRLLSPDEPVARAAFETADPERVQSRTQFMAALVPPSNWFTGAADEGESSSDDEVSDEADAETES